MTSQFANLIINRYLLSRTRSLLEGILQSFSKPQPCQMIPTTISYQKSNCTTANKQNKDRKATKILFLFFFYVFILLFGSNLFLFSLLGLLAKDLLNPKQATRFKDLIINQKYINDKDLIINHKYIEIYSNIYSN